MSINIPTQINLYPFRGSLFCKEIESIELFALTSDGVVELQLDDKEKSSLKDFGQFYIQLPPHTKRIDIEVDEKILSADVSEEDSRVIQIFVPQDPRNEETAVTRELSLEETKELEAAIKKSLPNTFDDYGSFVDVDHDGDDFYDRWE